MAYQYNGRSIETDANGYLLDINAWSTGLALFIAAEEDIKMTDEAWEIVNFLRNYYLEYQISPAVRVLSRLIKKKFGPEKASSLYLYGLFPYGPSKQGCKIAGLPKPTICI